MNITLVKPSLEKKAQAVEFKDSFFRNGEHTIYGCCGMTRIEKYEEWLTYLDEVSKGLREDRLPSSTYFAVEESLHAIVGIIDIRHHLNEEHFSNGHIGYSVRPDYRNKGYGTEILRKGLDIAKSLGIGNVLLTCVKENEGSRKVILNNSGTLCKEYSENEVTYQMYGIALV